MDAGLKCIMVTGHVKIPKKHSFFLSPGMEFSIRCQNNPSIALNVIFVLPLTGIWVDIKEIDIFADGSTYTY